jgi:uncharacterized protein
MNSVVHFEIPARNLTRAKKFYASAFGWKIQPFNNAYAMAYTTPVNKKYMPTKPGAINGGLQKKDKTIAATRVVVGVMNIDAAIKKVLAAGGKVKQPKTEIPGMLWYAIVADTEGNEVGLAQDIHQR